MFVKSGRALKGFQGRGVLGVLVIERDLRHRNVVVSGGRTRPAMLSPITIRRLLCCGEPVKDARSQTRPIRIAGNAAGKKQQRGILSVMIRRSSNVRRVVPGEIDSLRGIVVDERGVS